MSAYPIEIRNLRKQYKGGTWANRGITFSAVSGEILGIVGPNGAGKTTLVRQITTELLPMSGEVRVFGVDPVARPREVKGLMGVMPQEATLYWGLSVHHQFRIFGKLRGLPARLARRRRDELIADLDLEEHRRKSTETLSGGLRRRVLRYRHEGKTVLLTTHYLEEAEALCDRVAIIQDGSLLALDTVGNLRAAYGYRYKISFATSAGTGSLHGNDDRRLVAQVQAKGIDQYSLARTIAPDDPQVLRRLLAGTLLFGVAFSVGMFVGQNAVGQRFNGSLKLLIAMPVSDGITKSLSGDADVWFELAVLSGFTVVTMFLGTWKLPWREK